MRRSVRRLLASLGAVFLVIGLWTAQASAHVSISTLGTVTQGSYAKFGFSVPNERDDSGTVKVKVQFPHDHPLKSVSVQPVAGWDVETTMKTLNPPATDDDGNAIDQIVDTVTWTATGDAQIAPGQFQLFWVSAGPMPTDVTSLSFPAIQTYSNGTEVDWIEQRTAGAAEPEHPAPALALLAADSSPSSAASSDDGGSDDGGSDALVDRGDHRRRPRSARRWWRADVVASRQDDLDGGLNAEERRPRWFAPAATARRAPSGHVAVCGCWRHSASGSCSRCPARHRRAHTPRSSRRAPRRRAS